MGRSVDPQYWSARRPSIWVVAWTPEMGRSVDDKSNSFVPNASYCVAVRCNATGDTSSSLAVHVGKMKPLTTGRVDHGPVFFLLDVVRATEIDRAVRQLRAAAAAAALVPLSCLFVVAGIWTWNGASVVAAAHDQLHSAANASTTTLALCCERRRPSRPPVDCWIAPYLDAAGSEVRCLHFVFEL